MAWMNGAELLYRCSTAAPRAVFPRQRGRHSPRKSDPPSHEYRPSVEPGRGDGIGGGWAGYDPRETSSDRVDFLGPCSATAAWTACAEPSGSSGRAWIPRSGGAAETGSCSGPILPERPAMAGTVGDDQSLSPYGLDGWPSPAASDGPGCGAGSQNRARSTVSAMATRASASSIRSKSLASSRGWIR